MKNFIIISIIALLTAGWNLTSAQEYPEEYLGLPGDNLNLYAVMKQFQESETLEIFEKNLNDEKSMINNLDLNRDNRVDYIMVFDYAEGDFHTIVLRVALNKHETQDVAVFTVERFNDGSVQIQLVGDEALYGKNYIVEPYYADASETPNPGYIGNTSDVRSKAAVVRTTTYQVATWPIIRYIYVPTYVSWRSSWHWGYFPSYWNPWRPFYWHTYYGYHSNWHNHYYRHYRACSHHRFARYNDYYYGRIRHHSPKVVVNINVGKYKNTYSRPDLRKDGEAIYTRKTRNNRTRSNQNTSVSRTRNASAVQTGRKSATVNQANERRRSTTSAIRTNGNRAVNRSSAASSKSATVVKRRSSASSNTRTTTTPARRSQPASSAKSATRTTRTTSKPSAVSSTNKTSRRVSSSSSRNTTVTRPTSSGAVQKSTKISTNRNATRPSVSRSIGTTKRSTPSVSRRSTPTTKSATKVKPSRSSSRSSSPSVSRSSSSSSSRATAPSSRSSSTRSSGRR